MFEATDMIYHKCQVPLSYFWSCTASEMPMFVWQKLDRFLVTALWSGALAINFFLYSCKVCPLHFITWLCLHVDSSNVSIIQLKCSFLKEISYDRQLTRHVYNGVFTAPSDTIIAAFIMVI